MTAIASSIGTSNIPAGESPAGTGSGKKALWAGRVLSGLAVLFLGFDAVFKLTSADAAASASAQLGWSASAILQLESANVVGTEMVGSRRCHKLAGVAAARYPSGQRTGARDVTIWIDAESSLIRKVFEDTPESYAPGAYQRTTITIDPQANPALPDDAFTFTPPA